MEPIVRALGSFSEPDLIINRGMKVLDMTIASGSRMEESWGLKASKYGSEENCKALM